MTSRILSCFLATFVANGLARFGYVVLIPLMILSGTLTSGQSYALAIAILFGYIFGDTWLRFLNRFMSMERCASLSFLLIGLSFLACMMTQWPFAFAFIWRFLAGMASATLMILAAPLSLPFIHPRHKGKIAGLIFSGIGLGAVASGFLLPWLANSNINFAWISLAVVALLATAHSYFALKPDAHTQPAVLSSHLPKPSVKLSVGLWLLILSYSLNAIGYLGHTLFWADYLVRQLHFSSVIAGVSWAFFGVGAACGSLISGGLADKIGLKSSHILILLLKMFAAIIAACSININWLNISVFLMGFTTTGNVTLTNTMALYITGKNLFTRVSGRLTFWFGLFQALFSFIFSYWIKSSANYFALFMVCALALLLSAVALIPIKFPATQPE